MKQKFLELEAQCELDIKDALNAVFSKDSEATQEQKEQATQLIFQLRTLLTIARIKTDIIAE